MTAAAKPDPLQHLANKVNDHSTVLQAIQVDMQHMVKAIDKLVGVSEKQAVLGSELQRHSESIDRAFRQMDGHKSELSQAIRELAEAFKADRGAATLTANEVTGFKGSVKALRWALGVVAVVAVFAGGVVLKGIQADQARTDAAAHDFRAEFERRKLAVDIKIDALSQAVQEVRLDRQRDIEDKQVKKP